MHRRYLETAIDELCFADRKIALVSGPRQCGKTTFARMLLARRGGAYYNWDQIEFRRQWATSPQRTIEVERHRDETPLVIYDEIHKARSWKRTLKGIYDTLAAPTDILVTGSARLSVYRRGSDSLMGRYRAFRLHPFSLGELSRRDRFRPDEAMAALVSRSLRPSPGAQRLLADLLERGPFPEPLLAQDARRTRLWRRNRIDAVVREDIRDLTRIQELDRVQMLAALLPERVASPLSIQTLRGLLEASYDTVRRWILTLGELYYAFILRPYSKRIARSIRKEGKLYLWDYGEVASDGARFENLVAAHLLKACHYWTDTGEGVFDLFYLRDKAGREIDFLITRDGRPWLPVEAKRTATALSPAWPRFLAALGCGVGLQVVQSGHWRAHRVGEAQVLAVPAAEALRYLP
jgi:predicted AAA+ superfamily ATPase